MKDEEWSETSKKTWILNKITTDIAEYQPIYQADEFIWEKVGVQVGGQIGPAILLKMRVI